ncbi:hypothetical protein UM91_18400 [Pseudomonas oryzihabitans]|nr:hypothetical protein UM91_18400 [Pseudomonas oryzihabitans]
MRFRKFCFARRNAFGSQTIFKNFLQVVHHAAGHSCEGDEIVIFDVVWLHHQRILFVLKLY